MTYRFNVYGMHRKQKGSYEASYVAEEYCTHSVGMEKMNRLNYQLNHFQSIQIVCERSVYGTKCCLCILWKL